MSAIQVEPHGYSQSGTSTGVHGDCVRDKPRYSVHERTSERIRERVALGNVSDHGGGDTEDVDCTQQSANESNGSGHLKPPVVHVLLSEWIGGDSAFRLANSGSNSWHASRSVSVPVGAISNRNRGRALIQENMSILSPTSIIAALLLTILIFQSVTPWWQGIVVALIGAPLSAVIALYVNLLMQKRAHRLELEKAGDQSYAELGHVVLELTDKERGRLEEALARVATRAEEVHAKELQFLREQLRHRGNLEVQARNRTHDALSEVQRCLMTIREHEEKLREHEAYMRGKGVPFTPFQPFVFKTYDEIIGNDRIPMIPETEDGEDHQRF